MQVLAAAAFQRDERALRRGTRPDACTVVWLHVDGCASARVLKLAASGPILRERWQGHWHTAWRCAPQHLKLPVRRWAATAAGGAGACALLPGLPPPAVRGDTGAGLSEACQERRAEVHLSIQGPAKEPDASDEAAVFNAMPLQGASSIAVGGG